MAAGIILGIGATALGFWLAGLTNLAVLWPIPPGLIFIVLLVVCLKYRRYGYLTGFLLAPFVIATILCVLLLIICGHK